MIPRHPVPSSGPSAAADDFDSVCFCFRFVPFPGPSSPGKSEPKKSLTQSSNLADDASRGYHEFYGIGQYYSKQFQEIELPVSPPTAPAKMEELTFGNGITIKFKLGEAKTNDGNIIINTLEVITQAGEQVKCSLKINACPLTSNFPFSRFQLYPNKRGLIKKKYNIQSTDEFGFVDRVHRPRAC